MTATAIVRTRRRSDDDAVLELLHELVAEVRGLRADLAQRPSSSLTRADRARLAQLLPVIADVLGSAIFTVHELFASSAPALPLVLEGLTPGQVGKLLRRAVGVPIDELVVERVGDESRRALWRVAATV